jgi:hypothetical protein
VLLLTQGEHKMFRDQLRSFAPLAFALITVGEALAVPAQERPSPAALIAAQRDAMGPLVYMDGVWRGPAEMIAEANEKYWVFSAFICRQPIPHNPHFKNHAWAELALRSCIASASAA